MVDAAETVGASPAAEQHRRQVQGRFAGLLRSEFERAADLGRAPARDYSLSAIGVVGALTELVSTYSAAGQTVALEDVAAEAVRFVLAPLGLGGHDR